MKCSICYKRRMCNRKKTKAAIAKSKPGRMQLQQGMSIQDWKRLAEYIEEEGG